jgi:phosphoribosylglycinamide formyltransferase-1
MQTKTTVFASGGGSNFQALIDRKSSGGLHVDFVLMVGNNSAAKAFDRAREHGIKTLHTAPSHFADEEAYAERLSSALKEAGTELIVLAGYMKKLPPSIVCEYRNRIVNIHPALLPAFGGKGMYGVNVHIAALDYGAKLTGVTAHFVDDEYDHGPVILQKAVPVMDDDDEHTLASRVLAAEHKYFWQAVEAVASGRVSVAGRRVVWTDGTNGGFQDDL